MATLLPTCLVGSYPQPDWLVDRHALDRAGVPRVRMPDLWRVPAPLLEQAQDDATLVAISDQVRAGLDIITDGEIRRESYSNQFANALAGIDPIEHGTVATRAGHGAAVPLFSGAVRRRGPVGVRDVTFLGAHTDLPIKATLPGPFTMSEQAETTHYADRRALALDLADAVHEEIEDLFAAGADVVQLDEPWMERWPERAKAYGADVLNRAVRGIEGTIAVHICFGYASAVSHKPSRYRFLEELEATPVQQVSIETAQSHLELSQLEGLASKTIILGVIDLLDPRVETPETVADRIEAALEFVPPDRLVIAPDCGMKYLPRDVAFGKLQSMVAGAAMIRARVT